MTDGRAIGYLPGGIAFRVACVFHGEEVAVEMIVREDLVSRGDEIRDDEIDVGEIWHRLESRLMCLIMKKRKELRKETNDD